MNCRPKYCWRQRLYHILRYYFRQGLSKTTKIVRRSGRQSNPGLPECEVGTAKNSATAFGLCVGIYDVIVWFDGRVQLAIGYRLVFSQLSAGTWRALVRVQDISLTVALMTAVTYQKAYVSQCPLCLEAEHAFVHSYSFSIWWTNSPTCMTRMFIAVFTCPPLVVS
jgi:hypothetical protein